MSLQTIFKDSKGRWRDDMLWKIVPYTWRSDRKWQISTVVRRVRWTTSIDDDAERSLHRAIVSAGRLSSSTRYGGADRWQCNFRQYAMPSEQWELLLFCYNWQCTAYDNEVFRTYFLISLLFVSRDDLCVLLNFSISFNNDSSLMCVASDHGTIHVFAIDETHKNKQSRWCIRLLVWMSCEHLVHNSFNIMWAITVTFVIVWISCEPSHSR